MENQKKIISVFLIFLYFFFGCNSPQQNLSARKEKEDCVNDSTLYKKVNEQHLLYKDSLNNLYLKVNNIQLIENQKNLSNCQKHPYIFVKEMALKNDSIVGLKNVIDIVTFKKYSNNVYADRNRIYYFETEIATYPIFFEVDIKPSDKIRFDSLKRRNN